jgi:asparagine synthase (glutamine-hydrolysing)
MMASIGHRGSDGADVLWRASAALGHQHFRTTPEEAEERQPLSDSEGRIHLAFDGRLDNRADLLRQLDLPPGSSLSDAALLLGAFRAWGEGCFERLLGPFAALFFDSRTGQVVCGRDALGDRTLFWYLDDRVLAVASEESALLILPWISSRVDERSVAGFFAVEAPQPGATFFAEIRELPSATGMSVDGGGVRTWRHWQADPEPRLHLPRDQDYVELFRETLAESVRCRLRAPAPPVVMMRGGLDSTPVAVLAGRELEKTGHRLRTISWVFEELRQCDERAYMDPVIARTGAQAIRVPGDDAWPLADPETWPRNPNTPMEGLYRRLQQRIYAATRAAGAVSILSGEYGDELYSGSAWWLADLLREGRVATAAGQVMLQLGLSMTRRNPPGYTLKSAAARALGWRPRPRSRERAPWLTPLAKSLLPDTEPGPDSAVQARRPTQHRSLLDEVGARATTTELHHAGRAGVDMRRPYRDRRLIELALSLPAHQLYRPGRTKWILRQAMKGLLPESVRLRQRPNSLLPLCARGLIEREAATIRALLDAPDALWPRYVRPEWLREAFPGRFRNPVDGVELVIPWQCVCIELWQKRLTAKDLLAG